MEKPRLGFWQIIIELGGASGAPPRPPARSAGMNPAPLAAVACFLGAAASAIV
jgi:hypothetical protein